MTACPPCPPAPGQLEEYASGFVDLCFRVAQRRGFREYLAGLLAPRERTRLHQREIEQFCATTSTVFDLMAGHPLPGRMRSLLGDYYRDLITLAPGAGIARG